MADKDVMYMRYVTQDEADKLDVFLHNLRKEASFAVDDISTDVLNR